MTGTENQIINLTLNVDLRMNALPGNTTCHLQRSLVTPNSPMLSTA